MHCLQILQGFGQSAISVEVSVALEWAAARTMLVVTLSETRGESPSWRKAIHSVDFALAQAPFASIPEDSSAPQRR